MLTVKEIMTADPVTVAPETTLRELADLLAASNISGLPVVTASGEVVGVVSATDIISFTASMAGVPVDRSTQFTDWGEPDGEEETPDDEFFTEYWADSEADVVGRMRDASPEWDRLDEHTVAEVMSRRVEAVPVDATLDSAALRMMRARVHRLLVTSDNKLVGVVSALDFVRAVAEGRIAA